MAAEEPMRTIIGATFRLGVIESTVVEAAAPKNKDKESKPKNNLLNILYTWK